MWRPRTYGEALAAIGALEEASDLDFKRDLAANPKDLAKDAAAMSIDGGVILIGMDEVNGLATQATPIPLKGAAERLSQIISSRVRPPLHFELEALTKTRGDSNGLLVLEVPPSPWAPHMVENRFPARAETTTRYLEEPELERLYDRRRSMLHLADERDPMDEFTWPPDAGNSSYRGIGRMRLQILPLNEARHPAAPWLSRPLAESVRAAAGELVPVQIDVHLQPNTFDWLVNWTPLGSTGWKAGYVAEDVERLKDNVFVAAALRYSSGFSFVTTRPLLTESGIGFCAFEHQWASELMGQLAFAGHFFSKTATAGILRCGVRIEGLDGSVSFHASRGRTAHDNMPKVADTEYAATGLFRSWDLATSPGPAAKELLDPFFASFIAENYDVVGRLKVGGA
ncbi:ATP-binding protein [Solirubrobacter phytolaccae]|uniref:ATP-binding protein n=1 Tax=Solirubrobacter phytolaccae TaxID=1404360 RepID=A0A9X3SHG6_9ACTN|nr:ATP-binding protein [Solirubrobacter phytolaccae]MDA0183182.1 ATP-binding protein [Solirubrobacter phytolaccae]